MNNITTLLAFAVVLGVVVFLHEFGHYVVARLAGVHVEEFSLGFGPKLLTIRRSETIFAVAAIPLGGFCRLSSYPRDSRLSSVPEHGVGFVDARAVIYIAGPAMNLLLAYLCFLVVNLHESVASAPLEAFRDLANMTAMIFDVIWKMLSGEAAPKELITSAIMPSNTNAGWVALIALIGSISLNLGLLNLLPVPVLDGGALLLIGVEAITDRPVSDRVVERLHALGFVVLMCLMVTVIYNDLRRIAWIQELLPW